MYQLRFLGRAVDDAEDPEALKNNIKRLKGDLEDLYRLRVGRYRIIFRKNGKELVILIVRIGHRKDVYLSFS